MDILNSSFGWIMKQCYFFCRNYGLAIILFTFLTKIILLPVSVWVQKNSIKMVRIQPDVNLLKVKHFGDPDSIAEGQSKLYREEGYHPLASLIPLAIQVILILAVIGAIRAGMNDPGVDMGFLGVDMSLVPSEHGGWLILSPILAGASAWVMCAATNSANVLQSEQSGWNKWGMLVLSVALSVYLGWFVPVGVAVYWIASNLLSVAQLYILNRVINPRDYVDYDRLEESKRQLDELTSLGKKRGARQSRAEAKREREDYRRFFSVVNKHLVFHSEESGFYKYYRGVIEYILKNTNIAVHYITNDPNDQVFEIAKTQPALKPYYITEKKLITLMMKLDCDVMVMTMPDLENFHIKRSYVRKDIEYIYIQHGIGSINLTLRKGSEDHYDTVFCCGEHHERELRQMEELDNTPRKKLVEWGYCLLDDMIRDYEAMDKPEHAKPVILIAPSWQEGNIVDSCLDDILAGLSGKGYHVVVRPHPQHIRHKRAYMEALAEKFRSDPDVEIQLDFSSDSTVFGADVLISDWSSIAFEFAYTTLKPVLFINTPMKVMNPDYDKIAEVPIDIAVRNEIGRALDLDEIGLVPGAVGQLLAAKDDYRDAITRSREQYVYNLGRSAEVGAQYIISAIQEKIEERRRNS